MEEPDRSHDNRGLEWNAEEGVGPSTVMLEGSDGPLNRPEDVEVRNFGSERHGDGGVGCLAVEPSSGEAGSGHQVGYGFHSIACCFLRCWLAVGTKFSIVSADNELAAGDAVERE